jgi:hypothetical protein
LWCKPSFDGVSPGTGIKFLAQVKKRRSPKILKQHGHVTSIGGKIGGAILRAHQKKILARFHDFFEIANVEKPISFLRKISVLPKVFKTKNI